LRHDIGAAVVLPQGLDPFVSLFSESAGRAIVTVPRSEQTRFTELCMACELPYERIGVVDVLSTTLEVHGLFTVPLAELRAAFSGTFPALYG
jgi:phosphoribosylformylglycinamidine synthase